MVDTRSNDLRKVVDTIVEQMWIDCENSAKEMTELKTMMANLAAHVGGNRTNGASGSRDPGAESYTHRGQVAQGPGYNMPTKCSMVEFPRFSGEDLRGCIFRCEQFFEVYDTPFDAKVRLATVYLEGKALQWHQDPMAELMNLKQTGSIKEYLDKFDELLNNVELSEGYAQEKTAILDGGMVCDDEEEEEIEEVELELKSVDQEGKESSPIDFPVLVHAMSGVVDFRTMRVTGHTGNQNIYILINTGSTHNFLDVQTARRLGCSIVETDLFPVSVADGNKIFSSSACKNFSWKMQDVMFVADMMMIPLGGCDMVLGIQWLAQLGDIRSNLDKLTMEFMMNGRKVALRGRKPANMKVIDQGKMKKLLKKTTQISMLQVGVLTPLDDEQQKAPNINMEMVGPSQVYSLEHDSLNNVLHRVGPVAYTLDLPPDSRIHSTFHVSQLKRRIGSQPCSPQLLVISTHHGHLVLAPEKILDRRISMGWPLGHLSFREEEAPAHGSFAKYARHLPAWTWARALVFVMGCPTRGSIGVSIHSGIHEHCPSTHELSGRSLALSARMRRLGARCASDPVRRLL
ncbi:hypothetical protein BUALT_Bualt10G0034600 [Buddleja alternifolia]|uniref:Tf2-1-like SH3-like domain-containing protein n=1 Tax=Buddleja alternifolia TaxID=168488 RepID=A0AAV6X6P4_9LAMI|nr:hypothetical protein BUALT_Bualt10G0034600 [Buddleja alternifolia]